MRSRLPGRNLTDGAIGKGQPRGELIALYALMVSLVALSIDAMLPALPAIGQAVGTAHPNDNQLVISSLFFGLAVGQLLYGPLSDSFGRKVAVHLGLGLFVAGSLVSLVASSLPLMLAGRVLQGFGAAGPRIVTIALIRDQYSGRAMAQVMSVVMAVFILVPALAPALGQLMLYVSHWRGIFAMFIVIAVMAGLWFAIRQPETLPRERRAEFRLGPVMNAMAEVCNTRSALGYTLATGFVFGAFVGYLNSAQQILQQDYGLGAKFPFYFAVLALAIGGASLVNSRLVMRLGMILLSKGAVLAIFVLSSAFVLLAVGGAESPPLWAFMSYLLPTFFCIGILFGNLNSLAMEPLGHIAGVAATVIGFLSTLISVVIGTGIGQIYNGSVVPLAVAFGVLSLCAFLAMLWAESGARGADGSLA
jgi:DHA1 family bicyclomycin/chloramphenicol resistance-like MFS transporter